MHTFISSSSGVFTSFFYFFFRFLVVVFFLFYFVCVPYFLGRRRGYRLFFYRVVIFFSATTLNYWVNNLNHVIVNLFGFFFQFALWVGHAGVNHSNCGRPAALCAALTNACIPLKGESGAFVYPSRRYVFSFRIFKHFKM